MINEKKNITGEPLNILLVEDNMAHAELVRRGLEENRIVNRIKHLTDGEMVLDFLFKRGEYQNLEENDFAYPHVVLLDLRLPKIDGLEVLKEIKSSTEFKKLPIVILTTSNAEEDVAKAYEYHANSYIVKPINYDKFSELMKDLGFYWLC